MVYKCCVPGCNNTSKETPLHPFPYLDEEVYNIWIDRIKNETLRSMHPTEVRRKCRLCHIHFSEHCIVAGTETKLKFRSLPTIRLPGFHEPPDENNSRLLCSLKSSNAELRPSAKKKKGTAKLVSSNPQGSSDQSKNDSDAVAKQSSKNTSTHKQTKKKEVAWARNLYNPRMINKILSQMRLKQRGPVSIHLVSMKRNNEENVLPKKYKRTSGSNKYKKGQRSQNKKRGCICNVVCPKHVNSAPLETIIPKLKVQFEGSLFTSATGKKPICETDNILIEKMFDQVIVLTDINDENQLDELCQSLILNLQKLKKVEKGKDKIGKLTVFIRQNPFCDGGTLEGTTKQVGLTKDMGLSEYVGKFVASLKAEDSSLVDQESIYVDGQLKLEDVIVDNFKLTPVALSDTTNLDNHCNTSADANIIIENSNFSETKYFVQLINNEDPKKNFDRSNIRRNEKFQVKQKVKKGFKNSDHMDTKNEKVGRLINPKEKRTLKTPLLPIVVHEQSYNGSSGKTDENENLLKSNSDGENDEGRIVVGGSTSNDMVSEDVNGFLNLENGNTWKSLETNISGNIGEIEPQVKNSGHLEITDCILTVTADVNKQPKACSVSPMRKEEKICREEFSESIDIDWISDSMGMFLDRQSSSVNDFSTRKDNKRKVDLSQQNMEVCDDSQGNVRVELISNSMGRFFDEEEIVWNNDAYRHNNADKVTSTIKQMSVDTNSSSLNFGIDRISDRIGTFFDKQESGIWSCNGHTIVEQGNINISELFNDSQQNIRVDWISESMQGFFDKTGELEWANDSCKQKSVFKDKKGFIQFEQLSNNMNKNSSNFYKPNIHGNEVGDGFSGDFAQMFACGSTQQPVTENLKQEPSLNKESTSNGLTLEDGITSSFPHSIEDICNDNATMNVDGFLDNDTICSDTFGKIVKELQGEADLLLKQTKEIGQNNFSYSVTLDPSPCTEMYSNLLDDISFVAENGVWNLDYPH